MEESSYFWFTKHIINGPHSERYIWPFFVFVATLTFGMTHSRRRNYLDWLTLSGVTIIFVGSWYRVYLDMGNWDFAMFYVAIWHFYLCIYKNSDWDLNELRYRSREEGEQSTAELLVQQQIKALTLLFSPRLHFWTIGEPTHDRKQRLKPYHASTTAYLIRMSWQLPLSYLYAWWEREESVWFERTMVVWGSCWAVLSLLECFIGLIFLLGSLCRLLGPTWSPVHHPPMFGNSMRLLTHGLRGFWAKDGFWPTFLSNALTAPGHAFSDHFQLHADQYERFL
ncbi:hypothetical protein Slin15195_G057560 [Septoria linicola]|uniref:Wax synthase domain-containing protein n=1 Tax=Septoria linicola TaxID=215465 RepID=A0A9Q9AUW9_9PEZI|nr:hypothetical protein Slin14017_G073410 [Septoria linicola]USW52437.1 hypothetical protein Slin15195_G057560 [Septoria linicola]